LQNDLSEYFSLLSFANPNFLGSKNDFRKNFENLIIRGRDSEASNEVKAESEKKLKELGGLVTKFIIRRTNDLLSKYCSSAAFFFFAELSFYPQCPSNTNKSSFASCPTSNSSFTDFSSNLPKYRPCYAERTRSH
jgi:hypothetical protein